MEFHFVRSDVTRLLALIAVNRRLMSQHAALIARVL
jgi:hypothetical protein